MKLCVRRQHLACLVVFLASGLGIAQVDPKLYSGMKWRELGPFRGGRSCAVSGVVGQPDTFYMGTTGGGVWKTTDAGKSWFPTSDGFFKTGSVGAIGVAPSNGNVVYVGMGETELRGNITHGDGVYKTTDGGKTWSHVGLKPTRFISRVRVHPTNPDIVWVAALGPVFGPSSERGVFKTTDGGKTWKKTLFVSNIAGAVDISFAPTSPDTIYAATWEAWRTPYTLNSGGPGSKIFKSTDGGETWTDISSRSGLPGGLMGKIGISVSPADPNRIYTIIESAKGGLYRSDDNGTTWKFMTDNPNLRQRPWYYTRLYADPKNVDRVYVNNVGFFRSNNGGASFSGIGTPHSDHHDFWIDPNDNARMITGNDGGAAVSTDNGATWTDQDFATAQFYHVSTDNAFPYNVLGAQQDNSTVRVPSRTRTGSIGREQWTTTAGGESGYVAAKPDNPDIVLGGSYGGLLQVRDHRLNLSRSIDAWPLNPMGHGAIDLVHRFQWTYPIVFSPHDPNVVYVSSQFLLRSTNLGQSWETISPDLTRNDPKTLGPSGGPLTKDNTSVEYYGTIFTLAESPRRAGVIWTGSDDGLLHVTINGGRNWTNITSKEMPERGLMSIIEASPHDAAAAYVAIANYKNNDLAPYIYSTKDYGKTWTKIVTGIDPEHFVRVVREDPIVKGLLYAGTEAGVYVSFDDGKRWQPLQMNLPNAPIHDLVIKEDDIVVATHGRSFWILDDISPLRQMQQANSNAVKLFKPKDTYRVRWGGTGDTGEEPTASNPRTGVVINYYLPIPAKELKFELLDSQGAVVGTVTSAQVSAGFNRITSWMQYPSWRSVPGMVLWAAGPSPILAPPGMYTVRMTVDGQVLTQSFRWMKSPIVAASETDLIEQHDFAKRVAKTVDQVNDTVLKIRDLKKQIDDAVAKQISLESDATRLKAKLSSVEDELYQGKARAGQDLLNYPIKLNNQFASLFGVVNSGEWKPTKQSYDVYQHLLKELKKVMDQYDQVMNGEMKSFNSKLKSLGLTEIK